ncbi:MAG: AAA family ATPase [Polyangiaceae bacterium]|jgi:predicted ATPase|nr:AAA family ATPase [Polyangiaceae bacterium]
MIHTLECRNIRGIKQAEISGFSPLTVLVGPSGCGKSTLLDAIFLGAKATAVPVHTWTTDTALNIIFTRRAEMQSDLVRWLFWRGTLESLPLLVSLQDEGKSQRFVQVTNAYQKADIRGNILPVSLILPQPGHPHEPLAVVYTKQVEAGLLGLSIEILRGVLPGLESILMVLDKELQKPTIHAVFSGSNGSVPLALAGDGVVALARLCFELALPQGSVALIEEPEAHQHPRATRMSAKAMVAAMRRGVQVILSTHSLELIDFLLEELTPEEIHQFAVLRLLNKQGVLSAIHHPGEEVLSSRREIGEDLR